MRAGQQVETCRFIPKFEAGVEVMVSKVIKVERATSTPAL